MHGLLPTYSIIGGIAYNENTQIAAVLSTSSEMPDKKVLARSIARHRLDSNSSINHIQPQCLQVSNHVFHQLLVSLPGPYTLFFTFRSLC
jgi:hypothetical protein